MVTRGRQQQLIGRPPQCWWDSCRSWQYGRLEQRAAREQPGAEQGHDCHARQRRAFSPAAGIESSQNLGLGGYAAPAATVSTEAHAGLGSKQNMWRGGCMCPCKCRGRSLIATPSCLAIILSIGRMHGPYNLTVRIRRRSPHQMQPLAVLSTSVLLPYNPNMF